MGAFLIYPVVGLLLAYALTFRLALQGRSLFLRLSAFSLLTSALLMTALIGAKSLMRLLERMGEGSLGARSLGGSGRAAAQGAEAAMGQAPAGGPGAELMAMAGLGLLGLFVLSAFAVYFCLFHMTFFARPTAAGSLGGGDSRRMVV